MSEPTICLSMIVRDEAHILLRCLQSVAPYIDAYAVCDTGSLDDTCVLTRGYFKVRGVPGKVYHHKWVDFAHNRTLALQAAAKSGCDYALVIDADEWLVVEDPRCLTTLQDDAYRVIMRFPGVSYPRVNLMCLARNFRYVSPIHEYPTCDGPVVGTLLDPDKIHMETDGQGARAKHGDKNVKDLQVMQQWVVDEPANPRAWFYLAQGYEVNQRFAEALAAYTKRVQLGDYQEEVFYSHYRMAKLCEHLKNWPMAQLHYLDAYNHSPHRAEPLYWLAQGHFNRQQDRMALIYLETAVDIPKPFNMLFVEDAVYDYLCKTIYATMLYNVNEREDAAELAKQLLDNEKLPSNYRPVLERIAGRERVSA